MPLSRRDMLKLALSTPLFISGQGRPLAQSGTMSPSTAAGVSQIAPVLLQAQAGEMTLFGEQKPKVRVWRYNTPSGSVLRVKQGQKLEVTLKNNLSEPTTLHWHGVRNLNPLASPGFASPPVAVDASHTFTIQPPDAGTFWFHPIVNASEQLARGLSGVLVVEENDPPAVDQEIIFQITDWRLDPNGQLDETGFSSVVDAKAAGRTGNQLAVNGVALFEQSILPHSRTRLRIVNMANARFMALKFVGAKPVVIALDGHPTEPLVPNEDVVVLAPGQRADIIIDAPEKNGDITITEIAAAQAQPIAKLKVEGSLKREKPLPLPQIMVLNPIEEPKRFQEAKRADLLIRALTDKDKAEIAKGAGGELRGSFKPTGVSLDPVWGINGKPWMGHATPPLTTVKSGETVIFTLVNDTPHPQVIHIHGHAVRELEPLDDGVRPYWQDTFLIRANATVRVAFVAGTPGRWLVHSQILEHFAAGMGTWFDVVA